MIAPTENDLLAALRDAELYQDAPPDAMTAAELRTALGIKHTLLKKRLEALAAEGRLKIWRTTRVDMSGRAQRIPAYTILPPPKAAKRAR